MFARAVALTVACGVLLTAAQEQPSTPPFRTSVNYVRVDAYPTRNGQPVTDLTRNDFEILESGARQKIEHFEYVRLQGGVAEERRREPSTVQGSRAAAQNPRARVFVIFLDRNFVDLSGSFAVRRPLIDALDRLIGPDDLYAVMTPDMSAHDMTFSRRTRTFETELTRNWNWGRFDNPGARDTRERDCETSNLTNPELVEDAMNRRRERQTLNALTDMVSYLRTVREERKAIIVITQGWVLYGPSAAVGALSAGCGRDVMWIDHKREFLRLVGQANRANASFYAIDPRGLAVFDQSIARPLSRGPGTSLAGFQIAAPPATDEENHKARVASLRSLASGTDGLALFNSNDLAGSFTKIIDDLSSYYLLGYYSNARPDGRYHQISVRVKRPGITVRARRGYLAADATLSTSSPPPAPLGESALFRSAAAGLTAYNHPTALRVLTAAGWIPGETPSPAVWITGEVERMPETKRVLASGGVATVEVSQTGGAAVAVEKVTLAPGTRAFSVRLPAPAASAYPAEYALRLTLRSADEVVTREIQEFYLPGVPQSLGARWIRRGPASQGIDTPTADLRFRRNESLRVEIPSASAGSASARLLDRNGSPLPLPLISALRDDPDGSRWLTAELVLAPLAAGEYIIELSSSDQRTLAAFKLLP